MNILKLVLFTFLFSNGVASQNILISQGGNVNVSGGEIFYDAGGSAGNDGNTSYTITLSPPVGQSVCVDFISFSSFESFDIFDGTTVAANNIGSLKGNYGTAYNAAGAPYNTGQPALGAAVQAELKPGIFCANSASGALTFRFTNSSASQSTGWIGNVITYAKPTTGCTVNLTASPTTLCLGSATTLTATGTIGSALINNDFNASTLGTGWSATPGGVAFVNVLGCQPNYGYNTQNTDSSIFAWMQNVVAPRVLESNGFDVSNGGVLSFDFREASDDNGGNGCEALDDREGVYIQYSTNNGTSWNNMKLMFASVESNFPSAANIGCGTYVYNWNTTTVPIPAAAMSTNTKFRWYQNSSTTASQDSWGIDNVKIIKNNPITLTIIDLSTSVVVATASTNTVSVSVSPTSNRTYRATISDGITSCTNDVLVTVNSGSATTINYSGSPFLTSAGAANVTITNGPVSGAYSSTPVGLTLNTTTGAITPSTSTPGTYTVSVPTSCGTATATVVIATSICATCATPSCPVVTITTATVALGQTGITTSLNTAGDQLGNTPLVPGQNITVCVPVTVVAGSTVLGFKQLSSSSPGGCGSPLEEVMTYQLTSTACGATIPPNVTNASGVASGFNPEWNGLTPGNYVLCFTLNVTASALCSSVDLQGLGYYNVVPLCSNPVISSQPLATQTVCRNTTVTNLTVTATGSALTYQWYSNTSNSNVGGTLISSAVSATYTPSTSVAGTFYFYCIVSSGACNTTSNVSIVIINNSTVPTYTKTVVNCASGSINFSGVLPAGTTFNWLSGPSGYTFPIGFQTPLTTNTNLTALPAGTYCVDITSPTSAGGTITSTLFAETFESGLANWTLDNSNGPNIFVLNNQYAGGSCVTGLGTFTVPAVPNQPVAVTAGPNSNYLHIKATTTTGATCGVGSVNFIPLNANFDGQISDQKATLNTVINTVGKTNVRFNFYWLAQGETNANGSDDFGSIEYSINGGTTWIMSGAKLRRQTTWLSDFRTDPLWDNQANLRFRIRWNNDASSSVDPPISIDEIVITADSSTIASCGSTVNECIVILAAPAVPTVSTTVATCSANGTATVSNYSAALTYTSTPAGLSVGAGGVVTGFTCGTPYTITATNAATCFATSTSFTVQCQLAVPAVPTVSTTVATCSANGTATVSNYSAALTYTSTPAGLSVGAGGVVTGFTCGTPYIITATNASTCFATSASFTVQCQLAAPGVPTVVTTAATCSANGTATVSNYSAALTYTSTPAGLSVGAGGVVTGFTCGTPYTITATNAATCSATSTSFTVQCQLTAPAVPTVSTTVATCSANGTATVSNYSAALTYTSTPAGLSVGAGGVVTGFTCGTPYTITATNAATCFATSTSFTVQCQLAAPAVPTVSTTVATCSANGTATVSNYSAALTYTSTPAGLSVGAGGVVSGFTCGTPYTITATNASTCFATSTSFTVQCQLAAPAVPTVATTAATCSANGTTTVSNYSAALTYTSTPAGLSVGAGGVVTGFTCGTPYTITATNAATCFATSTSFTVQCQLAVPAVPTVSTTVATCSANGTATVSNYSAALTYTSTPAGLTVGAGGVVSGFTCGTPYTITATNASTCFATSVSFTVQCQLVAPAVPTVSTTVATCSANGTATVSNYSAALTYTSTPVGLSVGAGGVVSGFTCGTPYTITATNAATCFATSASFTVQCQLAAPVIPTVSTTVATCSANGTATVSNYSAALTYTSTPAGLSVGAGGVVTGFTCGTPYTITATNASTCFATSASFTVQCQLTVPAVPTVSTTVATCLANGTATVSNYSAALTYTSTPVGLSVGAGGVVSGFTCGTPYTITATNAATCFATSVSFTVQCQLVAPAVPTVSTTVATCSANGTATVSNYSAALTYTSTPAGLSVGAGGVVSGFTCGTSYTITATNAATCFATSASFTVQCQLAAPAVPTVSTTVATCSANGTATVSNYSAALTYTSTPAGLSVGAGGVVSGFTCGTPYTITATNASTCFATSTSFTVQCQFSKPVLTYTVTNPICDGSTLDFVLNSNVPGTTYTWSASNNDLSGFLASGDQTNINQLVQLLNPLSTNGSISMVILPSFNGCVGDPVSVTILVRPNPRVTSITQEDDALCSGEILHMDITGEPSGLTYNWTAVNINGVLISSGVYSGTTTGAIDLQLTTVNPTAAGTIQFEITPIRNGCSGTPVLSDVITVNPIPGNPIGLPQPAICSGETTNINVSENLLIAGTLLEWEVIASNNVTGFTQTGSALAPISINDILFNNSNAQGFVTYRITSVLGECEGTFTDITVLVNPLPKPVLTDGHICVDATTGNTYQGYLLDTQLSNPNFTYEWFLLNTTTNTYETIAGANASTYEAMVEGNYQVIVTNSITNCIGEASADVIEVFPATAFTATVSDAFTNNSTITVTVNPIGTGSLIYALDDGAWQVSNVFTGVEPGSHTVLVSDLEGCTNLSIEVIVIDYPKFFTPNGDGYNDTWNIIGLNQADAKLYVFDRYGKLIKQLSTTDASKGWDGTYNGAQLPSTDYWFTLDYTENGQQKVFKSHFSLKR